jgi:type II secretory ATPase GspE/PulE/Tfp pilus assembly ATPase PilB-like protein
MATSGLTETFDSQLSQLEVDTPEFASEAVDVLLATARAARASDIHLIPAPDGLEMAWRVDGVLQPVARFSLAESPRIISRLKVLADLLTYRTQTPQEGRIRVAGASETRVSTFPTLHGEKVVVRLFAGTEQYGGLTDLGIPAAVLERLQTELSETSGVILVVGPAGSGKTTTCYACLREILSVSGGQRSLVSLEDPVEVVVDGVAQSHVQAEAGMDMQLGLRSLMRQDPDVIMVGEIRDRETAETVFQAALTGHLVLSTFHAGSVSGACSRLLDMDVEPYLLRSGLRAVVCQRLLRRLCRCAGAGDSQTILGVTLDKTWTAVGCADCRGTGYRGRMLVTEMLVPAASDAARKVITRSDSTEIERQAIAAGMVTQSQSALEAVARGETSVAEVIRVLGIPRCRAGETVTASGCGPDDVDP